MFARKAPISDRRPPPPGAARTGLGLCARCGAEVALTDGMHGRSGLRLEHFVCDPDLRSGVTRQIEAMRALHRASAALRHLPVAKTFFEAQLAQLPDVTEVGQVLDVLGQARTAIECTRGLPTEQRRLALSYLDALLRKL